MQRARFTALAAMVAAFLGLVAWEAYGDLDRHRAAVEQRVETGVLALDEHASRVFGEVDLALSQFHHTCPTAHTDPAVTSVMDRRLADVAATVPQLASVALADAAGRVVAGSAPWTGASVTSHDYLVALREEGRRKLFIGAVRQAADGAVVPVGFPLADEHGSLCGIALAGVRTAHFVEFYRSFLGDDDGVLSLRQKDGRFLVRVSSDNASLQDRVTGAGPEPMAAGVHRVVSPVDGAVRIGAYRKLANFPLIVRIALSERAVVAQWRRETAATLLPSLVFLALLVRAWLRVSNLLEAAQVRERQLADTNADLRAARKEAESATRAKTMFLANMSHEIRTPLNAIVGLSHLLDSHLTGEPGRTHVARLQRACDTLLRLISGILDLSKVETGQMILEQAPFDLHALLHDLHGLVAARAAEKGLCVRLDMAPGLDRWVLGDSLRLSQVLANRVDNAVKFTAAGEVVISAANGAGPGRRAVARFSVRDSGIGLGAAQIAGLFEPFQQADASTTRRFGGTGLGLAISQRLLRLMGSTICIESEPGGGSTFSFQLELPVAAAPPETPAQGPSLQGLRVLLVDDDPLGREVTGDLLRLAGADVVTAGGGHEAVELCQPGTALDVVLMDLHMPGLDGLDATRRIRGRLGPDLPIIGLSADALATTRDRALAGGMTDYLVKPFDPRRLARLVGSGPAAPQTLLDATRLDALREVYGAAQLDGFVARFEHQLDADLDLIRTAFEAGDDAALAGAAHRVAGTASQFACARLTAVARSLAHPEAAVCRAQVEDRIAELERLAQPSRTAIRRALGRGMPG